MKNRLWGYVLGLVAFVGALAFLRIPSIAPGESLQGPEASWLSHHDNYTTLVRESQVIIVGRVLNSVPFLKERLVFTTQEVEVQEVISGNVAVGDILPIIQTGGVLEEEGKETPPFVDSPLMEEEKTHLLFLERSQLDPDTWWWIMGGYQGRVDIRRNGMLHLIQYRVDRDETVARELHGHKLEDAKREIRQIVEHNTIR